MSNRRIYAVSHVHLAVCQAIARPSIHPPVLCCLNINIEHYVQTFQPNSFTPAMLMDAIDFYHFITIFSDFDLGKGFWDPWNSRPVGFTFLHSFNWLEWDLWWCSSSSYRSWYFFLAKIIELRAISAVLLTGSKNLKWSGIQTSVNWCGLNFYDDWYNCVTLTLIEGHRDARKQKCSCSNYLQTSYLI